MIRTDILNMNKLKILSESFKSLSGTHHYCSILSADVAPLASSALFSMYYSLMPPHRREKIDRLRIESGKRLSLGAGVLLRHALASRGIEYSSVRVETTSLEKPYLPDYPNLHFSLSHSGSRVLCVTSDIPCGCDVEELGRGAKNLVTRFYSPEEQSYCLPTSVNTDDDDFQRFYSPEEQSCCLSGTADTNDDFQYRFTRVWTRKESYLKATGEGFSRSPESFSVFSLPPSVHFHEYTSFPGYHISICLLSVSN